MSDIQLKIHRLLMFYVARAEKEEREKKRTNVYLATK